jgi:hypothetical protein
MVAPGVSWRCLFASPEGVLEEFYAYGADEGAAEDMLTDPLIVASRRVVPAVAREVQSRDMPKRRYALGFLQRAGDERALPALRKIVADESEDTVCRTGALNAICAIDADEGRDAALRYNLVPTTGAGEYRRTYWEAFFGIHH